MYYSVIWAILLLFFNFYHKSPLEVMVEICDNALDDDGDGLIDLNDPDCKCDGINRIFNVPSGLISNPSFEEYINCPNGLAQLNQCKNWIQASNATSDYYHTCGFWKDDVRGEPPSPLPAGNGYVGFLDIVEPSGRIYKEYIGTCLNSTMQPGLDYTLRFRIGFGTRGFTPLDGRIVGPRAVFSLSVFGNSDCSELPFRHNQGGNARLCPTADVSDGWYEMARRSASGILRWVQSSVTLSPNQPINTIVIGPSCAGTDGSYYFWLDDLHIDGYARFNSFYFNVKGNPCSDTIRLEGIAPDIGSITYQWYKDGIAIIGATGFDYVIPFGEEGVYQMRAFDGSQCQLSNVYKYKVDKSYTFIDTIICEGEYLEMEGTRIDKEGFYTIVSTKKNGCDSTIYLNLLLAKPKLALIDTTVCRNTVIKLGGRDFSSPGVYTLNLISAEGCDSTLEIKINHVEYLESFIDTSWCQGQFMLVGQDTISQPGLYKYWYISSKGCDSLASISIKEFSNDVVIENQIICQGDTFYFGGIPYYEAGQYDIWTINQNGCDSLSTLKLSLFPSDFHILDTSLCSGEFLTIGNSRFENSGDYSILLSNTDGCDSLIDLHLTIRPPVSYYLDTIVCEGTIFEQWGRTFNQEGVFQFIENDAYGCDENFELKLTLIPTYTYKLDTSICENDYLIFRGNTYNQAGHYEARAATPIGCDSIFILELTTVPVVKKFLDTLICFGEKLRINDLELEQSGHYQFSGKSKFNCDSILDINLTILPAISITENITQIKCHGQSDGKIELIINGGLPPYTVQWSNGSNYLNLEDLGAGRYEVMVSDQLGCIQRETFEVLGPECFCFDFVTEDLECFAQEGKLEINHKSGGKHPFVYLINGENVELLGTEIQNLKSGTYKLLIIDQDGCPVEFDFQIEQKANPVKDLGLDSIFRTAGDTAIIHFGGKLDGFENLKIDWTNFNHKHCETCHSISVIVQDGPQVYFAVGIDENGCEYEYKAIVIGHSGYWVPNVFSPNGDGINDYFNLYTDLGYYRIDRLQIYDRWGSLLFESKSGKPNSPDGAWFGESRGQLVNSGVYTYLIMFSDWAGKSYKIAGDVTLIR